MIQKWTSFCVFLQENAVDLFSKKNEYRKEGGGFVKYYFLFKNEFNLLFKLKIYIYNIEK